jgi:hypothetical protein
MFNHDFEDEDKTPVLQLRHCRTCQGAGAIGDENALFMCEVCEGRGLIAAAKDPYAER